MSLGIGIARALGGFAQGLQQEDERRRLFEERAQLRAAAELKDRLERERQARLDQQQQQQTAFNNTRTLANEARTMTAAGFSPYQPGMVDGATTQAVQGMRATAPNVGAFGGMIAGAAEGVQALGQQQGATRAAQQGGYLKTGMSETERIREDEREARVAQQRASLEQQAALARERMAADAARTQEQNALRRDLAGMAAASRQAGASTRADARAEQVSMRLRSQYEQNPAVKQAYTIASQLQGVEAAAQRPDAAGDLSMIYAYMKILDPNSVVRETEFATAQNAAGVPDRVRNLYNRAMQGTRLTPDQRKEFLSRARSIGGQARMALQKQNERYGRIAGSMGVDPSLVVYDPFGELDGAGDVPAPTTVPTRGAPAKTTTTRTQPRNPFRD